MTIRAQAFDVPRLLTIRDADSTLGTVEIAAGALMDYSIDFDAETVMLDLISDGTRSPADAGRGEDTRQLAIMIDSIVFTRK